MTILILFEFLNFLIYQKKGSFGAADWRVSQRGLPNGPPSFPFQKKKLFIILKNFQIGLLLGLFIDAFKVGS